MRLKLKLALIVTVAGLCVGLWPGSGMAAAGVIYLSPSSTSVRKDDDFIVALRINPGTAVDSVQATVNYSTSHLDFVSLVVGGTFSTCVQDSGGGGVVKFSCAKLGGSTSSDSLIADITFKALVGSGSTPLTISNANAARSGSYTNPSASGATVSFTSPPTSKPKSSSTPTGNSGGTTNTPASPSTTTPSKSTTKKSGAVTTPVILKSTVKAAVAKVQITNATINVTSTNADQLYVLYGTNKGNLNMSTQPGQPGQSASIKLDQPGLSPVTLYYYQAVAKDPAGNVVGESPVNTLITKGYTVSVTVLDSHYHPIAGKVVTLHSEIPKQATTNNDGVATFSDVQPGQHSIAYTSGSHTYTQTVYVANNVVTGTNGAQSSAPQTAAVVLSDYAQPSSSKNDVIVFIILAIIVIVSILITEHEAVSKKIRSMKKQSGSVLPNKPSGNSKAPLAP